MEESDSSTRHEPRGVDIRPARRRARGQAAVIVALASLTLLAFIGLAVDGGSMFGQRRNAQNSADAAAMAATRVMLDMYDQMILANASDVDGTPAQEASLSSVLLDYAHKHNIQDANLAAYYVDDNKQLVTSQQVGQYNGIPWSLGAKGIMVKNRSETDSFFMKLFGWNKVGASAQATAFMGLGVYNDLTDIPLLPIGYFTETANIESLNIGTSYNLINHDKIVAGNIGYVSFNGQAEDTGTIDVWLQCGFNPKVTTNAQWNRWCPSILNPGSTALGPTDHYQCGNPDCSVQGSEIFVPYLQVGTGLTGSGQEGWWVGGSTGNTNSVCGDFYTQLQGSGPKTFYVPIFNYWIGNGNNSSFFHLARIGKFRISTGTVDCHPDSAMYIDGIFEGFEDNYHGGTHGDLRHTKGHIVFLEN